MDEIACRFSAPAPVLRDAGPCANRCARRPIATWWASSTWQKYKATIEGLARFGDRRQGTERNRKALDWIEAQLKSYGCTNTERLQYQFTEPAQRGSRRRAQRRTAAQAAPGQGGSTLFGNRAATGVNTDPMLQPDERLRA